jgi:PTH1 family peptidyl-tRNA hydrolase
MVFGSESLSQFQSQFQSSCHCLVVGLGNPGPSYEGTRHNVGFDLLDRLAQQWAGVWAFEGRHKGLVARVTRLPAPIYLLKPQTFMNVSGQSVASLARFFKIEPARILVVHDDIDLLPGTIKLKTGGGHAGHNGLKDIDAQLGTRDYWRLRIGVGRPALKEQVVSWVLQKPSAGDRQAMQDALEREGLQRIQGWVTEVTKAVLPKTAPSPLSASASASWQTQSTIFSEGV